ncbi:MAG: hypothetical protein K0S81_2758 [Rhodospirillales bacterium]|nr:hypothetical protein [Rhodospirillales bacterium]
MVRIASISRSASASKGSSRRGGGGAAEVFPHLFRRISAPIQPTLSRRSIVPPTKKVLASQTEWSRKHISRFRNFGRVVGRVSASRGRGRGAALGVVRLRPGAGDNEQLRARIRGLLNPGMLPGIISLHLVESDPELSKNLNNPDEPNPGGRMVHPDRRHAIPRRSGADRQPFQGAWRPIGLDRRLPPPMGPREERPLTGLLCPTKYRSRPKSATLGAQIGAALNAGYPRDRT